MTFAQLLFLCIAFLGRLAVTLAVTSTYISTVTKSRTITLPDTVPIGAKVAVVLLPAEDAAEPIPGRDARFASVMAAIRAAIADNFMPPDISDAELTARIERARRASALGQLPG